MSNDYVIDKITGGELVFKNGEGIFILSPTDLTIENANPSETLYFKDLTGSLEIIFASSPDDSLEQVESQELDDFLKGFRKRNADGVF